MVNVTGFSWCGPSGIQRVHGWPVTLTPSVYRIGCYREVNERALSDKVYPSADYNVTVELCAEFGSFAVVVFQ